MHLLPREVDKLAITAAGSLAQHRLARGLRLNYTETIALITHVILELIRDGAHSVSQLMNIGRQLLGERQTMAGVASMIESIQVEGTFIDGTKLVTIHEPIVLADGDLSLALHGSFLPVPALLLFDDSDIVSDVSSNTDGGDMKADDSASSNDGRGNKRRWLQHGACHRLTAIQHSPGVLLSLPSRPLLTLNASRPTVRLSVMNHSDRPCQVGSHYHFIETNPMLEFDRLRAYGYRLNIPAGTAVRFEPGERKVVSLVSIGGGKRISGGNRIASGAVCDSEIATITNNLTRENFKHLVEPSSEQTRQAHSTATITSSKYLSLYGPTVNDRIHLADTGLIAEVDRDLTVPVDYGDELVFGGGKVVREGMGQMTGLPTTHACDLIITNIVIIDYTGVIKADIGIKDGRIVGIGKSGNPDVMDGVDERLIVGVNTDILNGAGMVVTAGAIDTHIHFICPQLITEALHSGVTTMIGGGTGPSSGTAATTCTPSPFHYQSMLQSTDQWPINIGLTGKGNSSDSEGLVAQIKAGACGLKLHEDWASTPSAIDNCLTVADRHDVQVTIHTDTLNESCNLEGTIRAINNRTIHAYHSEGAGGGHAPDIIAICGHPSVIPSSTNPTRPYTVNTLDEHLDMLMFCHHLHRNITEDIAFAESRIRGETIGAEDVLHDRGVISVMSSDSQAMGRVGETVIRTWQTAAKNKLQRGHLVVDGYHQSPSQWSEPSDNARILRYVSKYTINPALVHGLAHEVGSVEVGKLADLVLYRPALFGVKPEYVIKGGVIAVAAMGDANGSIPSPQPVAMRKMFVDGLAASKQSVAFVSQAAVDSDIAARYQLQKRVVAVQDCRSVSKTSMKWNCETPRIAIDPETFDVTVDGELCHAKPAQQVCLAQRYALY